MLRLAAGVLAVAVCLAGAGDSNGSGSAARDPSSTTASPLRCNASHGVHFQHAIHRVNGTSRTILKVLIKDRYNVTLPPAPPTTPSLHPPTVASLTTTQPTPSTAAPTSPTTAATPTTTVTAPWDSAFQFASSTPMDPNVHTLYDDWDYMDETLSHSKEEERILALERFRHEDWQQIGTTEEFREKMEFCTEAAKDDDDSITVSDGSFHPRYEEVPGVGVYRLHAHARTWEEARKMCEREGTQLAVPNSREEALALTSIHNRCPRLLPTHFNDYQYLGVHDLYSEGDWETVVGYPLNETGYYAWAFNQPDNAHHHGENCLSMNRNGFFNDVPCWTELPYICEHP